MIFVSEVTRVQPGTVVFTALSFVETRQCVCNILYPYEIFWEEKQWLIFLWLNDLRCRVSVTPFPHLLTVKIKASKD